MCRTEKYCFGEFCFLLVCFFGEECSGGGGDTDKNCVRLLVVYFRKKVLLILFNVDRMYFPKNFQASQDC